MPKQSKTSGQAAGNGKSQQPRATFTMVTRARSAGKTAQQKAAPSRLRKRVLAAIKGLSPKKKGHKHAKTIAEAEPDVVESEAHVEPVDAPYPSDLHDMDSLLRSMYKKKVLDLEELIHKETQ